MKALRTQFDADEFAGVVATPTCSSCCCCSCCAATLVGAGAVGAVAVVATASDSGRSRATSVWLGLFAGLLPVLALGVTASVLWTLQQVELATLLVVFTGVLIPLFTGYFLLFRALRGRPAIGLTLLVAIAVFIALCVEAVFGLMFVANDAWLGYLIAAGIALALLAVALTRPAVRDWIAEAVRGTEPLPPTPSSWSPPGM